METTATGSTCPTRLGAIKLDWSSNRNRLNKNRHFVADIFIGGGSSCQSSRQIHCQKCLKLKAAFLIYLWLALACSVDAKE